MRNKKENITIIIIIVILTLSAGVIGWMLAKNSQDVSKSKIVNNSKLISTTEQSSEPTNKISESLPPVDEIAINDFSIAIVANNDLHWSSRANVKSDTSIQFRWTTTGADSCNISGGNLFNSNTNLATNETGIKKVADDFSNGIYTLKCVRKLDNKTAEATPIILNVTPAKKLVMCMKKCGNGGIPIQQNMNRFSGETVQKVRACFGNFALDCPTQDVTKNAEWLTSNNSIITWSKDYTVDGEKIVDDVYPNKTLKSVGAGNAEASVTYSGYSYVVRVDVK